MTKEEELKTAIQDLKNHLNILNNLRDDFFDEDVSSQKMTLECILLEAERRQKNNDYK